MNLLEAKIYYDGSNWIAIPHTERPYSRDDQETDPKIVRNYKNLNGVL